MLISNPTRFKLNETKYFLSQLNSIYSKYLKEQTPELIYALHYNLSAFYSAARGITLFMQNQYSNAPDFDGWYKSKREEMKDNKEMKFLILPKDPCFGEQYSKGVRDDLFIAAFQISNGEYVLTNCSDDSFSDAKLESAFFSDIWDLPDILELCSRQFEELENIVNECEKKYGSI
jgi:hypothetical protein